MKGNILVTGGAGFIGRAIIQAAHDENWDARLTVFSRDEAKQWEVAHRWPDVRCVIGDVRDPDALESLMVGHDVVIHAAALKFIPEAEYNVDQTLRVNVEGARNVARAAARAGVRVVVGISTDKACNPTTTYGLSKACMERLYAEANTWAGETTFVTVRYGNVVGSTGSVIPVFRRQLQERGRITITDPRMTRFWLSPGQAVGVIEWATASGLGRPGSVFIPACPAMSILELAATVRDMEGKPQADFDFIGIRVNEKLNEVLLEAEEASRSDRCPDLSGFILQSPIGKAWQTYDPPISRYSSDAPASWVSREEMASWIEEASRL